MSVEITHNTVTDVYQIEVNEVGVPGPPGKRAYQSYLDTTADNPKLTEAQWSERAQGETGNGIASTIDNGNGTFTINYTDGSSWTSPDLTGPQGEPFVFEDFTPAQLLALKGEKGDKGEKGEQGGKGDKGDTGNDAVWTEMTQAA